MFKLRLEEDVSIDPAIEVSAQLCLWSWMIEGAQAFQLHGHLYTLYFFSLFWGHGFFAFQHNLGTFCRSELLKLV
jgi:hypothetical protein